MMRRTLGATIPRIALAGALVFATSSCTDGGLNTGGVTSFQVNILQVNGADPPTIDKPLTANIGTSDEVWDFEIQAVDGQGKPASFDGFVRVHVEPGSVNSILGEGSKGRNVLLVGGKAKASAYVTTVYGPSRLWAEDVGYTPVPPSAPPKCADGLDNDDDGVIDYPADPGCAFADDDTEAGGSYAAGVSDPVYYSLPRIADVQGAGTETPYPFEGIQAATDEPQKVIVTRVSSDGFYATDLNGPEGASNSIFAFNFNTPPGMRVCDRLVYFSGTMNEFFGSTQFSFPSYDVTFPKEGAGECEVPEPTEITGEIESNKVLMETLESNLVRLKDMKIASNFGPKPATKSIMCDFGWCFGPDQSNCDLNGDGQVDFQNPDEGTCGNVCSDDPECTEWTGFSARGNYKVSKGATFQIQIQTASVADFDPPSFRGQTLTSVTGTMRNFSGGSLNWTIETRCPDDLVCSFSEACSEKIFSSKEACVRLRTTDDPDETL